MSDSFQSRVQPWMMACFGAEISRDREERGDRLLEEVFELLQSGGYDPARIIALRDYTWSRPIGEPSQEVGGVMVTLAAYCLAHDLDMHQAAETELARIWTKVDKIREKQKNKPTGSALPQAWPAQESLDKPTPSTEPEWLWWAGDGEVFHEGFPTREKAFEYAHENGCCEIIRAHQTVLRCPLEYTLGDLELAMERANACLTEEGDGFSSVPTADLEDLIDRMNTTAETWFRERGIAKKLTVYLFQATSDRCVITPKRKNDHD